MIVRIHRIRVGLTNVWLVRDRGTIVVDAGAAGSAPAILKRLETIGIGPKRIGLIVLTHGHGDHAGAAAALSTATGAPLAVHLADKRWVEGGASPFPPGVTAYGRFFARLMTALTPVSRAIMSFPRARVDVLVGDEGLDLRDYGISGRLVYTPGHTPGSLSVVLDSGEAFVGDLAMNGLPFCLKPSLGIFATDELRLKESWRRRLGQHVKMIYPGHGSPFPIENLKGALS